MKPSAGTQPTNPDPGKPRPVNPRPADPRSTDAGRIQKGRRRAPLTLVGTVLVGAMLVGGLLGGWALLGGAAPGDQAAAQSDGRIDLVAQTAFVGDDPATIDLRLSAPAGSRIRIQIFEALGDRDQVRASYQGLGGRHPFSDFSCAADEPSEGGPCQLNSTGEILSIEIPDQEVGEILRVNQGALPVVITLRDDAGNVLDTLITHLLVLDDHHDRTLHIAFFADLSTPLALQPDQSIQLDTRDLLERANRVAQRRQIPIAVAIQPETLQALAVSEPGLLDEFIDLLADRPVLNAPWVDLDEEAWRLTNDIDLITDQYRHGTAVITEILGHGPSPTSLLDRNATPQTLALLRSNGTETAIVHADRISADRIAGDRIIAADRIAAPAATATLAPIRLAVAGGETMTAIAIDDSLRQTLNHPDPQLAGQRALTELAIAATNATADRAILFDLDDIEAAALDVILDGVELRTSLRTSTVARALRVPVARGQGRPAAVTLTPATTPDLSQRSADIGVTRGTVAAYASMIAPERTPITALETLMRAAAASRLSEQQSAAYTRSVFEEVLNGTADITIEPAVRITLTDRRADLRITVRNGQPLPITVEFLLSAEKLRFVHGERFTRTLDPGDNEILVRVETLATGDDRVTVNIASPQGRIELTEGVVDIRSTAISGLGLVISIVALAVLGGWWARTFRRVRRSRAAATVARAPAATVAGGSAATVAGDGGGEPGRPERAEPEPTEPEPTDRPQQDQEEL